MKVVIPVAGAGVRLRPHTYTQPKPLMPVAGKPIISFIIDKFREAGLRDFVFVIGYLGEKIKKFVEEQYPDINSSFVIQEHREGSAHALWMAKSLLEDEDEIFIAFGDTIFDADLSAMFKCENSCIGIKKVNDPRDFGVVEYDKDGIVTKVVEKPTIPKSNSAMVGLYRIKEVEALFAAVNKNISTNFRTMGEFQLTDALQGMIEAGIRFETVPVGNWFDCGRKEVLLETNAMLLSKSDFDLDSFNLPEFENTIIVHPVAIGKDCTISNSIIGPHVTIGNGVSVSYSIVKDSIIGNFASLDEVVLKHSVIGSDASVKGLNLSLNIGDNTEIEFD